MAPMAAMATARAKDHNVMASSCQDGPGMAISFTWELLVYASDTDQSSLEANMFAPTRYWKISLVMFLPICSRLSKSLIGHIG